MASRDGKSFPLEMFICSLHLPIILPNFLVWCTSLARDSFPRAKGAAGLPPSFAVLSSAAFQEEVPEFPGPKTAHQPAGQRGTEAGKDRGAPARDPARPTVQNEVRQILQINNAVICNPRCLTFATAEFVEDPSQQYKHTFQTLFLCCIPGSVLLMFLQHTSTSFL